MGVPGRMVGARFVLQRLAGAGGMGEVYKALDQHTGLPVAVKVAREGTGENDTARFVREARVLAELDHARIVRHVANGLTEQGAPWLAMEWLEGEDLAARLGRGRLGVAESVAFAIDLAEGLAFAHARGVVHRDLKPSNVFLIGGKTEDIRILDFGIAQLGATRMTRTGMLVGTPGYMAPEQARGDERIDARADVYSLGCLLFECLIGAPLFSGGNVAALLAKILFEEPPRARDKRPGLPESLDALLERFLDKQPSGRPEDGRAVAAALRALGPLDALGETLSPQTDAPATPSLTGSEQRSVAVLLIGADEISEAAALAPTLVVTGNAILRDEAERYGGHYERLLDGSVAVVLTGAALATDLAAQAARCALALRAHAAGRTIALAMGRAGSSDRLPVGQAFDRAAKLCGVRPEADGQVYLDDVVAGLLDARFDVRESEAGFALHGERQLAEGARTLLGKATPCVGRERELRFIEQAYEECLEERAAQVVLVTAPAGVGKSRLGQEFLRSVRDTSEDVALWIARGDSLRAGSALGMLGQVLRSACGIREGESVEARRETVRARVSERVGADERRRVTEFLGELIGTPFPDEGNLQLRAARLDAQLMTEHMRAAFLDFLAAECASRPVLILLEDLHWGDRSTVQFLDRALRDLSDNPVFVLALGRPEVRDAFPDLWAHRKLLEIRLKELSRRSVERLVRHVLGESVGPGTVERLARLSEGNAFYLEELIRCAAEGRGADLPETVVAMVQSRLGTLDETSRRVLRAASVFGEVSWTGGVATLLGEAERKVWAKEWLSRLMERELFVKRKESRFPDEDEYAFRHALLREGAYAMLTDEDRALGHKLAGEWLEARGEEDALLLADHFEKGGDKARAAHHYLLAASRAQLGGDSTAAIANTHRGLACAVSADQRVALLGRLCEAHFWHVESLVAALPYAEELFQIAERGSWPWIQGMGIKLNAAMIEGRVDEFDAVLWNLMELDPSVDAAHAMLVVFARAVIVLDQMGRVKEANVVMDRSFVIASTPKAPMSEVLSMMPVAMVALRDGFAREDPASGLRSCEPARIAAEAAGDYRIRDMVITLFPSMNRWWLGDSTEAERLLLSVDLPDEAFGYVSSFRPFALAWILADRGALAEARVWASRLVAAGQARRLPLDEGLGHWVLAEVSRRAGELDAAHDEIGASLALLKNTSPLDVSGALATLAALRLDQGKTAEALAAAEDGLARYTSMGACSQFFRGAFLRLNHAECLLASGQHDAARVAIREARARILANAEKIDDAAYRRSFLEDVPENRRTFLLAAQWLGDGS